MKSTKIATVLIVFGVFGSVVNASGVYFTINGPGEIKFNNTGGLFESSRRNIFYRDNTTGDVSVFWDGAAFLGEKQNSPQVNALHVTGNNNDFYFSISKDMAYQGTNYTKAGLIHYNSTAGTYTTTWQVTSPPLDPPTGLGWDIDALVLPNNDLSKILFSVGNNNSTFQNDDIIQWTLADGYSIFKPDLRGTIGGPGELDALLDPNLVVGGGNWPGAGGMFDNTNLYYWDGTEWTLAIDLVSSFQAGPSGIISVHGEFEPPDLEVVPEPLTVMSLLMCVSGIAIYVLRQHGEDLSSM